MPEKYVRTHGLPILVRHTGPSTLPEQPPLARSGRSVVCLHDAGLQSSIFTDLLGALGDDVAKHFVGPAGDAQSRQREVALLPGRLLRRELVEQGT